jgi:phosphohistidine phosphatase
MKKLLIIRHAKSSWDDPSLEDYERPLNKRGKKNAPFMGELLYKKGLLPDKILSSGAKRAKTTAKIFQEKTKFSKEIEFDDDIYFKDEDDLIYLLQQTDDRVDTLYLVGHNPTLNFLAYYFVDFDKNIPTCGIVQIDFDVKSWSKISNKNAHFVAFEYPKKYTS